MIHNSDLYKILEKLFDRLGKGDILDVIDHFDREKIGYVRVGDVQAEINNYISDFTWRIKLHSRVDNIVSEKIFDETEK
jgi:hypothetical protein